MFVHSDYLFGDSKLASGDVKKNMKNGLENTFWFSDFCKIRFFENFRKHEGHICTTCQFF